jgi:hypothetical protein
MNRIDVPFGAMFIGAKSPSSVDADLIFMSFGLIEENFTVAVASRVLPPSESARVLSS